MLATAGRESDAAAEVPGLYAAGWLKRGPSGIIGSNVADGKEAAAAILSDYLCALKEKAAQQPRPKRGHAALAALVAERSAAMFPAAAAAAAVPVSWAAWQAIDAAEVAAGAELGKPRAKFTSVAALMSAAVEAPK